MIYNPWFEPISTGDFAASYETEVTQATSPGYRYIEFGPHWFGNSSTWGVLADGVTKILRDAQFPGVENHPLLWKVGPGMEEMDWQLGDYLRTPVSRRLEPITIDLEEDTLSVPETYWEFAHPQLPIVKVTSYSETVLPLTRPGQEPTPTYFAVSFVASFQNRWAAFEDPNRWLIRFEDDLQSDQHKSHSYTPSQGGIDDETQGQLFPNYWHNTDYMQLRIIGPVVVRVYESDVIQPGTYSFTPRVTHWVDPGHIVPDDRQLWIKA